MKHLRRFVVSALLAYCSIAAVLFVFQRQLLYVPTNVNPSPEDVGLRGVEVIGLPTPDGETLILWHAPAPESQPTVLFLQGNGGEIGDRARRFQAYQSAGFGVAFLSYRGYGGSTGSPTETGLVTDARAAYDWLLSGDVAADDIALIGESLGTGVAVQLAAGREVGALILTAPYTTTVDVAARQYPWLPVSVLMKDQFRSVDHIDNVTAPILIHHGTEDTLVPHELGRTLAEAAGENVSFVSVQGAGHGLIFMPRVFEREIQFINEVLLP